VVEEKLPRRQGGAKRSPGRRECRLIGTENKRTERGKEKKKLLLGITQNKKKIESRASLLKKRRGPASRSVGQTKGTA